MKAKRGRMQRKPKTQSSRSADGHVMNVVWQRGHGAHQQRLGISAAELGGHGAL